ncbi:hypothetical protein ALC62_10066 [Cyphomyrmex costatus]|uniref:Uncharacterized protein n=1 Tax=Cyphomyrmex costatus TaxID=456900 RepID=A0A151IEG2_9HYME|nr:hypothetical protein ALC62_10066 [Cyphomyrmex costatus]
MCDHASYTGPATTGDTENLGCECIDGHNGPSACELLQIMREKKSRDQVSRDGNDLDQRSGIRRRTQRRGENSFFSSRIKERPSPRARWKVFFLLKFTRNILRDNSISSSKHQASNVVAGKRSVTDIGTPPPQFRQTLQRSKSEIPALRITSDSERRKGRCRLDVDKKSQGGFNSATPELSKPEKTTTTRVFAFYEMSEKGLGLNGCKLAKSGRPVSLLANRLLLSPRVVPTSWYKVGCCHCRRAGRGNKLGAIPYRQAGIDSDTRELGER